MTKPDTGSALVFVYGTLRRGGSNAFRMDGAEFVGKGEMKGRLYRISWYPGLVLDHSEGWVLGDLFEVGSEQLRDLDEFEGLAAGEIEGSEYRRTMTEVRLLGDDETWCQAWVWEWIGTVDRKDIVSSGDWFDEEQPK